MHGYSESLELFPHYYPGEAEKIVSTAETLGTLLQVFIASQLS